MIYSEEIQRLRALIEQHNHAYYVLNEPTVSDEEYDLLYQKLSELEKAAGLVTQDSPTQKVGGGVSGAFKQIRHEAPMLSIRTETNHSAEAAHAFDAKMRAALSMKPEDGPLEYFAEPKYDGLGLNLKYVGGKLVSAATRGDGYVGEDVTANAMTIEGIPHTLITSNPPEMVEVRGEVVMRHDAFRELNQKQLDSGKKPFVNPRNAAAGSLRQLDPAITAERKLSFYAYGLGGYKWVGLPPTQSLVYQRLQMYGFSTWDGCALIKGPEELEKYHREMNAVRNLIGFDIDGVVYKVNDLVLQERLGYVSREPVWAVAHKFAAEVAITTLIGIGVQVGRTGKLTPVAKLEPVFVGGVTVKQATLSNVFDLRSKKVRVGDLVYVRRAGDVVPEILGPVTYSRATYLPNFKMPKQCPCCGSAVVREKGATAHQCTGGFACSAQRSRAIMHYAQRRAVFIDGLGEKVVDKLVQSGKVKTPADLYKLTEDDLMGLEGIARTSAEKLVDAIRASRATTLPKFLYGLGIRHVGESTATDLAKRFKTLTALRGANPQTLMEVPDVGEVVASSVVAYFGNPQNATMIDELVASGLYWDHAKTEEQALSGKVFVITGRLPSLGQSEAKELIERFGGKVASSVSAKTNYLVAGEDAGEKLTQAQRLNIPIISEQNLVTLINPNQG